MQRCPFLEVSEMMVMKSFHMSSGRACVEMVTEVLQTSNENTKWRDEVFPCSTRIDTSACSSLAHGRGKKETRADSKSVGSRAEMSCFQSLGEWVERMGLGSMSCSDHERSLMVG